MSSRRLLPATILAPVFIPAVLIIALLVLGTVSNPELAGEVMATALARVTHTFGWFYMLAVAIFLVFIIGVAISRWGHIKLGPDHADPQYSFVSWFAMLFSAGYGIALLFFGVAEPVLHYAEPPAGAALTVDSAQQAMQIAFFHWGFHIWAVYGLVGLVLAYFAFRHGLPLSMRSALYPMIGERIHGPIGHAVDVFAILGTMFGIATTLGLSVIQINAGIHYLLPSVSVGLPVQISAIVIITSLATLSVVAGLDKGIKRLSLLNMLIAVSLMTFIFLVGPGITILERFLQNTGSYLNHIVERTFNLQAYTRSDWIGNWTLFIFGWTISWAPFVGLFIAKISRGRTIRQFVFGVILVPAAFTFLWFSIFGDTALHLIMNEGYSELVRAVQADHAIALFKLYEQLPLTPVISVITVLLIITFFVTSADSGALVVDSLASGGLQHSPAWQRLFWAGSAGLLAAVLLVAGGLSALQTMAVLSALPFAIIMLISAIGLWRALVIEGHRETSLSAHTQASPGRAAAWRRRLGSLLNYPDEAAVSAFLAGPALRALHTVAKELHRQGWPAEVDHDATEHRVQLAITKNDQVDFLYEIRLQGYPLPDFVHPATLHDDDETAQYYRAEVFLRRGGQAYDVHGLEEQELIQDVLDQLEKYLIFRRLSPSSLPWDIADNASDSEVDNQQGGVDTVADGGENPDLA